VSIAEGARGRQVGLYNLSMAGDDLEGNGHDASYDLPEIRTRADQAGSYTGIKKT